jgi:hypothetical protein
MNNTQSNIERIVMQRVHLIRALRFAVSSGALSMIVSLLGLWGIGREVWIARVLQNAPTNLFDLPQFYIGAFLHTNFIVQACVVLTVIALLYVAREIVRAVSFVAAVRNV